MSLEIGKETRKLLEDRGYVLKDTKNNQANQREKIFDQVEAGEISAGDAMKELKKLREEK